MAKPHLRAKATASVPTESASSFWGSGAHRAASNSRDMSQWFASSGSADSDLLPDLPVLIPRARDIRRNNGFAQSIAQTSVDTIAGSGIRMCSQPDYSALQAIDASFDADWADKWSAQWESVFHEWYWSTACHAGDTKTGDMIAEETLYSEFDNGASLTLPLWLPNRGDGFATKLRTVEVDRLSNPNNAQDTRLLRRGIEFDPDESGRPIACYVRNDHPGEWFSYGARPAEWVRIPRRTDWGRLRWIHRFDSDRPDQTTGKPWLSAVLDQFKNIDRYVKAEIEAAVSNANIWGAITTPLEAEEIAALFESDRDKYFELRRKHAGVKMKSNTLATLFPGDKLESFIPGRPNPQFATFVENIESIIAIGAGMPYVMAAKDFSKSNYSNTRAAMLEGWRTTDRRRDRFGAGWLDPVAGLLLEEMVNVGRIIAPRFYEFRRAYLRCSWIGPGQGYIDKVKEATGDQIMLDGNTETLQRVAAKRGMHWRELIDQRAMERKYIARMIGEVVGPNVQSATMTDGEQADGADPTETNGTNPTPAKQQAGGVTVVFRQPAAAAAAPVPDPAVAALAARFDSLEAGLRTVAGRPPASVTFEPGAFQIKPQTTIGDSAIHAQNEPAPVVPDRRLKIESKVAAYDAEGLILRVLVWADDAETGERVWTKQKEVVERDPESRRLVRFVETEVNA